MPSEDMYTFFKQRAAQLSTEIMTWRRHLHAHPERSFCETRTTAFIAEKLKSFGYADIKTGFSPLTSGAQIDVGAGPHCVLLRADIDALPITETADVSWRSQAPGVMHACGHDAHTAILLGAAKMLKELELRLPGKVRLIFQPGEEEEKAHEGRLAGGSKYVVGSGALDGVDAAFACHVWGVFPAGAVFIKDGPAMMASSRFIIKVTGSGTHGATPHLGRDPVVATCQIISALQTLISREISPIDSALITVGTIHGGTIANVIPQDVEISGTIRAARNETLAFVRQRIAELVEKTAEAHRCKAQCAIFDGCSSVMNNPDMADIVREVSGSIRGQENVHDAELITASEDFCEYASKVPSALFFLGMADSEKGTGQSQHDPAFQVNDDVLADAAAIMASAAWRYLAGR